MVLGQAVIAAHLAVHRCAVHGSGEVQHLALGRRQYVVRVLSSGAVPQFPGRPDEPVKHGCGELVSEPGVPCGLAAGGGQRLRLEQVVAVQDDEQVLDLAWIAELVYADPDQDGALAVLPHLVCKFLQLIVHLAAPDGRLVLVVLGGRHGQDVPAGLAQPGVAAGVHARRLRLTEHCFEVGAVAVDVEHFPPGAPDLDRAGARLGGCRPSRGLVGPLPAAEADHVGVGQVPGLHQHYLAFARYRARWARMSHGGLLRGCAGCAVRLRYLHNTSYVRKSAVDVG